MDDSYSVRRMAFLSNLETYIIEILGEFFNTDEYYVTKLELEENLKLIV